jgi:hypothetical protein
MNHVPVSCENVADLEAVLASDSTYKVGMERLVE